MSKSDKYHRQWVPAKELLEARISDYDLLQFWLDEKLIPYTKELKQYQRSSTLSHPTILKIIQEYEGSLSSIPQDMKDMRRLIEQISNDRIEVQSRRIFREKISEFLYPQEDIDACFPGGIENFVSIFISAPEVMQIYGVSDSQLLELRKKAELNPVTKELVLYNPSLDRDALLQAMNNYISTLKTLTPHLSKLDTFRLAEEDMDTVFKRKIRLEDIPNLLYLRDEVKAVLGKPPQLPETPTETSKLAVDEEKVEKLFHREPAKTEVIIVLSDSARLLERHRQTPGLAVDDRETQQPDYSGRTSHLLDPVKIQEQLQHLQAIADEVYIAKRDADQMEEPVHWDPADNSSPEKQQRYVELKEALRRKARLLWKRFPEMKRKDMARRLELVRVCIEHHYKPVEKKKDADPVTGRTLITFRTIEEWIKDLRPGYRGESRSK